ncbi:FAD-dependent monooxygenase [Kitasatospora sp. NPDC052896]|uniref:FAD-dependent monooxygenase n=1 Tax=Kitasatospora sp. NPDC052896 TaxID=3364061 RepID=UPI0037CB4C5F
MTSDDVDVLIAGAGPTGLLLANELQLAGVGALVLERLPERTGQSKALGLQPRTAEILQLRGWLEPVLDRALATIPGGHFAGMPLDYSVFDTPFPYQLGIPQARVEECLENRLTDHGVPLLHGHELTDLAQDDEGVTATVTGPDRTRRLRARYLVGADGGRSTVRHLLGMPFPGRDGRLSMVVADVVVEGGPAAGTEWRLPSLEPDEKGLSFLLPLDGGVHRLLFGGPEQQRLERSAPVTEDEVRAALFAHHGDRVRLRELRWASRFTDASRQAERYRDGRVLLAGDAAHIHLPAGGQGLNLGMQDAFNLGWKLAAQLHGWAPERLLDSYHAERHPVGAMVLENTRAQGVLSSPDPDARALRATVAGLLTVPEANRRIAGMISGLDIRYPMPGSPAHPLLGARLPGIELPTGRGLLLTSGQQPGPVAALAPWTDRVDHTAAALGAPDTRAVLVRPDGYVCWVGRDDTERPDAALRAWFGAPARHHRS